MSETVTIPREEYVKMKHELETLRCTKLYKRLLEFEGNIKKKEYTRQDLGF